MKKNHLALMLLLLSPCAVFAENETTTEKTAQNFDQIIFEWTRDFANVLQITKDKHYKATRIEEGMIKAIDAFINEQDPHSNFLGPKTYKAMLETTAGEFFGIGVVIDNTRNTKDKFLVIVDTIPDGPADKVGIKAYDKIIEIDGKPLEGMTTEEATSMLKGKRNTTVHIKVLREEKKDLIPFDITRDVVKEQHSLSFHIKDHDIYYLSLTMFTENAVSQIKNLLKKANENQFKGLILDLRSNSGGLLTAAVEIAGLFLDKGSLVVTTKDKNNTVTDSYKTKHLPIAKTGIPIFILINNYTASAAEILAGVLQIHAEESNNNNSMVFLLGTQTFGKGSVQEVIPVGNDCALKITTHLYFLPNDKTIQGKGIMPDFIVERTNPPSETSQWFTKYYGRESTLKNYIKTEDAEREDKKKDKKKKAKKTDRWQERAKEMLQKDNQLREAISLINLLYCAQHTEQKNIIDRKGALQYLKQNHITDNKLAIEEVKV